MNYFLSHLNQKIKPNSRILEIANKERSCSQEILAQFPGIKLEIIGQFTLDEQIGSDPRVTFYDSRWSSSLDILPRLLWQFDYILLNGGLDYFTTYNQLKLIDSMDLLKKEGQIFVSDWPYGIKYAIIDWLSTKSLEDYEYKELDPEYGLGVITKKKTTLTDLAVKYDSDKFGDHDYTRIFEEKFLPLKMDPVLILEIGILNGASLKMWADYFSKGHIYGLDIEDKSEFNSDRITTFLGSQNDIEFLTKVGSSIYRPIDIIIDDGSHINSDVITSFRTLFKFVSPLNGLYIIEDTQTSYWPDFGGDNPSTKETILGFFTDLAEDLNYKEVRGAPYPYFPESLMIKSIEFSHNLIIITKAPNCYPSNKVQDYLINEKPLSQKIHEIKWNE